MSYDSIRNISVDQKDKVRQEYEAAKADARAKRAELTALRESANDENVDLSPNGEAFRKMTDASAAYSQAKQHAQELEFVLKSLQDIDGEIAGGKVADAEAKAREIDAGREAEEKARKTSVVLKATERFMDSPQYRALREQMRTWSPGDPAPRFRVDDVFTLGEFRSIAFRAAGDNVLTGASDTSGGALVWPEQDSRYIDLPFRPTRVLDVITQGTTDSDTIEYVAETTKTNAAAATAEATNGSTGALAESALVLAVRSVAVENIGHYIPATTRALADAGQLDAILRNFLIEGCMVALETEVFAGDGTTPNLEGIATAVTATQAVGADTRSDAMLKGQTAVRVSASINDRYEPTVAFIHPNDLQDLRLEKDDNGNYIYGGPTAPRSFPVWGMRPVETLAATEGTVTLGDPRFAQLWLRSGVSVAVSDSHDDWFISNIIAMKAQVRAAFKVTRPAAFIEVTGF